MFKRLLIAAVFCLVAQKVNAINVICTELNANITGDEEITSTLFIISNLNLIGFTPRFLTVNGNLPTNRFRQDVHTIVGFFVTADSTNLAKAEIDVPPGSNRALTIPVNLVRGVTLPPFNSYSVSVRSSRSIDIQAFEHVQFCLYG